MHTYQPVVQACGTLCTARLHNRLVCRHNIDHVINDEHNRTIIVVLAKHEIALWWWFLREPKHVGAIVGILIVLTFLWFYNCVHQFGIIKKCFDTVDARCKHEETTVVIHAIGHDIQKEQYIHIHASEWIHYDWQKKHTSTKEKWSTTQEDRTSCTLSLLTMIKVLKSLKQPNTANMPTADC